MLERPELVQAFEEDQTRREAADHQRNLKIAEALYLEARRLGALPLDDPLDGIQVDIELAKALNVRRDPHQARQDA